ncbi:MAG: Na/Pi cotransporter family protein [Firmicutes bacterium]|nr:Na/Pi cotransporter family protein [Bacillota bacterium]
MAKSPDCAHIFKRVIYVAAVCLCGGLVLFLAGLRLLALGLEALWGTAFAGMLQRLTGSRLAAFCSGLCFTALTQSSSLTTVLVVGLTEAGLLPLQAAIGVIIGANVGTTVTGQLLSFNLADYALLPAVLGLLLLACGGKKTRLAGWALVGFAVMLWGMKLLASAVVPLQETRWFATVLALAARSPLAGVAVGAAAAAIVQSSSAVAGVTLSLARAGILNLSAGAAIMMGADIGTCTDTLLAGFFSGKTGRQAAFAHLLFNVCSVILLWPALPLLLRLAAASAQSLPRQLANVHTLYNLCGACLMLFLLKPFQTLVESFVGSERLVKKRILPPFSEMIRKWF